MVLRNQKKSRDRKETQQAIDEKGLLEKESNSNNLMQSDYDGQLFCRFSLVLLLNGSFAEGFYVFT